MKCYPSSGGFSFIELLVVLVIVSCLCRLAAPAMQNLMGHIELEITTHKLIGALRFTRLLAVTEHHSLALCGSSDLQQADGHWFAGWVVVDPSEGLVKRSYAFQAAAVEVYWRGGFGYQDCIRYDSQGFTMGQQGSFRLVSATTGQEHRLVVSRSGRVRMS